MRRSICTCEPHIAHAGETGSWKFSYTTAVVLPKGTRLKFDLMSKGRLIDWELPQINLKEKKNLIWAESAPKKPIQGKAVDSAESLTQVYEFTLPSEVKAGEVVNFYISNTRAQSYVQRRRPFHLYIDPKGKGDYKEPEIFTVDIKGGALQNIRIVAPSIVEKNKRFDVIVRFEDEYGNLTSNAPEGTLIELSYEQLRESLTWKLFVPETGFISLPNLYFNEVGVYKIQLRNMKTQEKYFSPPIKCLADVEKSLYWGLLHGESEKIDSTENVEVCLRHFRDEKALQFFSTSPFESAEECSNDLWKQLALQTNEFNEEGRYTVFLGFQWFAKTPEEGLRQFVYAKEGKQILRYKDSKSNMLKKIYKSHSPKELLSIPCFTMGRDVETTFEDYTPEFERVVEIYNAWGSSECTEDEGNLRPISTEKKGVVENKKGSIRAALSRNCRFGFVAGGLDDRGIYSGYFEGDQVQYSPGLTAIVSEEQTRDSMFNALMARSCYATTGERIIVGFQIAGQLMGSELSTKAKPGLAINRHITGYVAGTAQIAAIEIIRNGEVIHTFKPKSSSFDIVYDDSEPLASIVLGSPDDRPHFVYYYLRVIQEDDHIAWTSPIWIDYPEHVNKSRSKR